MVKILWRQGVLRKTRLRFWSSLYRMYRGGIRSYLSTCAQEEHFIRYRQLVRDSIARQLERHAAPAMAVAPTPDASIAR